MPGRRDLGLTGAALLVVLLALPVLALVVRRRWRLAKAHREEVRRLLRLAAAEAARAEIESRAAYASSPAPAAYGYSSAPAAYGYSSAPAAYGYSSAPAAMAVDAGYGAGRPQCAVCYSPTNTRCSRCKAVRYCSGRCQIIHWRQGHKEECHSPRIDDCCNGTNNVFDLKETEQSGLCDNSLEIKGRPQTLLVERLSSESNFSSDVFSEDSNRVVEPFVDTSGSDSTFDSFADSSSSSSGCSSSTVELSHDASVNEVPHLLNNASTVELSHDASVNEVPHLLNNANMGKSSSHLASPDSLRTDVDACEMNHTEVAGISVNNLSCTTKFDQKASGCKPEEVNCRLTGPFVSSIISDNYINMGTSEDTGEYQGTTFNSSDLPSAGTANIIDSQFCEEGDHTQLGVRSPLEVSSKLSGKGMPSQPISTNANSAPTHVSPQLDIVDSTALGSDKSGHVARENSNDLPSLKTKGLSSLSSISSTKNASSNDGGRFVSHDTTSDVDNAPPVRTKSSEGTCSVSNDICDLKTSVRKVVQQFKPSQILRHYPSVFRSDLPGKYKMLFSYDLFIKLYNYDKVDLRPFGLTNCGNSCYVNAVLQCLSFTRPLTAYLLQGLHTKECPKREWCFTCEFESLIMKAKEGQSSLSPIGIFSQIQKIGSNLGYGRQEDAHEFLRYAIDAMQSVCLKEAGANAVGPLAEETTLIQLIFGGYLLSKIKCTRCQGKSERHERMMDLTVEIHGDIGTLEEALARFTATEVLDGENKYLCNRCKSYERAKKKLSILEAPNVLTIALKRFQSGQFGKLNKAIRFPEYLNLAPYMSGTDDKSPVYRLYGVVVHLDIMKSTFSGHYVCYVRSTQKKWYKIDDSMVKPVEVERVLSKNAYMLLYARCSPRAPRMIRNAMAHTHAKNKSSRCKEALSRPASSSIAHERRRDQQHTGFQPTDLFDERFLFRKTDSSSDSSSLFSCSDEGSWSTESTRNSTSTEFSEYRVGDSGRFSWNDSSGFSEDDGFTYSPVVSRHASEAVSNGHSSDLLSSRIWDSDFSSSGPEDADDTKGGSYGDRRPQESTDTCFQGNGSPAFLYSDTSNQSRKLTEQCSSRDTDWYNPYKVKSSVTMRSCSSRERTAQTFY